MFNIATVVILLSAYIGVLFIAARWGQRRSALATRFTQSGVVYALTLAVYCTSWTYYGAVGHAATSGFSYIAIYLGPTIAMFAAWVLLRKMVRIKNRFHITSLADFISLRYDQSSALAALVTVVALVGGIPYIALQLKALIISFKLITLPSTQGLSGVLYNHFGWLLLVVLVVCTILFGVRHLDPTERNPGLIVSLAIESIVKLLAFLAVGAYITFGLFDGFGAVFSQADLLGEFEPQIEQLKTAPPLMTWLSMILLSMSAVFFLPRQFHMAVIENTNERQIRTAQWLLPLYLFLISLFVMPIALAGLLLGYQPALADSFVLRIPLENAALSLSLFVFLGGFSAAIGMIMISAVTTSIMVTNHLLLPIINAFSGLHPMKHYLLPCRRGVVALFILAGYGFCLFIDESYMLVNIGIISFAAALQFAPLILIGLFSQRGNQWGALAGLGAGFSVWLYTLMLPACIRSGWLSIEWLTQGPWSIHWLRPESLFGVTFGDSLNHATFWSLLFNISFYALGSALTKSSQKAQRIANECVNSLELSSTREPPSFIAVPLGQHQESVVTQEIFGQFLSAPSAKMAYQRCLREIGLENKESMTLHQQTRLKDQVIIALSGFIGVTEAYKIRNAHSFFNESVKGKS